MLFNFYQLDLHNKTCVALSKSIMKLIQKPHWKSDLPLFSYGYRKCMFVDFLTWVLPVVFTIERRVVINKWDVVQSLLNMCLYDIYSLILTEPHTDQI